MYVSKILQFLVDERILQYQIFKILTSESEEQKTEEDTSEEEETSEEESSEEDPDDPR